MSSEQYPLVEIAARGSFSAAHRLTSCHLSSEQNVELFGPCTRTHGHNYRVKVRIQGPLDPVTGMVVNLKVISTILNEIVDQLDHCQIDQDIAYFRDNRVTSTSENVAIYLYEEFDRQLKQKVDDQVKLIGVKLSETNKYSAYYGGKKV